MGSHLCEAARPEWQGRADTAARAVWAERLLRECRPPGSAETATPPQLCGDHDPALDVTPERQVLSVYWSFLFLVPWWPKPNQPTKHV